LAASNLDLRNAKEAGIVDVSIIPVQSPRDRHDFIAIAGRIYQDDRHWVPPIRGQLEPLLGWQPHAFYEQADSQAFLARRGEKVVGRILAIHNHAHVRQHGELSGFFGFFESDNDQEAAGTLLETAYQWLKDRSMVCMRGPVSPSLNYECGLLVDGFDTDPCFMTTYNPPYYMTLLKKCGCRKVKDLLAYVMFADDIPQLVSRFHKELDVVQRSADIAIRTYSKKSFQEDLLHFIHLYNESMDGHWGSVPLSGAEMREIVGNLRWLLVPDLVVGAERDGNLVGAAIGLLDYNPLIRDIGGRLFPFGLARLMYKRTHVKRVRIISMNVSEGMQAVGLGVQLTVALLPAIQKRNIREVEASWVLEDNLLSRGSIETAGGQPHKRYRIYEYGNAPEHSTEALKLQGWIDEAHSAH
jgi:hypothetical protein